MLSMLRFINRIKDIQNTVYLLVNIVEIGHQIRSCLYLCMLYGDPILPLYEHVTMKVKLYLRALPLIVCINMMPLLAL